MSKSRKNKKHYMEDENFDAYKKIRKPKCKPSRAMTTRKDTARKRKYSWRDDTEV